MNNTQINISQLFPVLNVQQSYPHTFRHSDTFLDTHLCCVLRMLFTSRGGDVVESNGICCFYTETVVRLVNCVVVLEWSAHTGLSFQSWIGFGTIS